MALEKYDEYSQKMKNLENQRKQVKQKTAQKMAGLNKQKIQLQMNKLKKKFSQYVAGSSSYNQ